MFRDPTTLPQGIYLQQFRERQEQTKNYVLNNTKQSIENAFLFAKEGLDVDFNNSVLKHVRRLENKVDPDFIIGELACSKSTQSGVFMLGNACSETVEVAPIHRRV